MGMKPFPTLGKCDQCMNFPERQWMYAALQHTSAVGMGFIPVLLTTSKIQSKYPAAAREGMKPSPTVTDCCNRVDNSLITKVLYTSAVGAGFIPALPTADKIQSKYPAAAREEINGIYFGRLAIVFSVSCGRVGLWHRYSSIILSPCGNQMFMRVAPRWFQA